MIDEGIFDVLPYEEAKRDAIERFQRRYIEHLMFEADGNVSAAARKANMTRAALHRILKRLGLGTEDDIDAYIDADDQRGAAPEPVHAGIQARSRDYTT